MDKRPGFKKKLDIETSKNMVSDILKETDKNIVPKEVIKEEKKMRRINAEIPLEVWDAMDKHITKEGYNLKGFLTKILKEYLSLD